MSDENYTLEKGDCGSAGIEKIQVVYLMIGSLVMIKGHLCKIVTFSTAKTGKYGATNAMVTFIDFFSSKKYECTFSTSANVEAPVFVNGNWNTADFPMILHNFHMINTISKEGVYLIRHNIKYSQILSLNIYSIVILPYLNIYLA